METAAETQTSQMSNVDNEAEAETEDERMNVAALFLSVLPSACCSSSELFIAVATVT